jgi:hypothetical protein
MDLRLLQAVVFIQNHVSSSSSENQSLGLVEGGLLRAITRRIAGSYLAARSTDDTLEASDRTCMVFGANYQINTAAAVYFRAKAHGGAQERRIKLI